MQRTPRGVPANLHHPPYVRPGQVNSEAQRKAQASREAHVHDLRRQDRLVDRLLVIVPALASQLGRDQDVIHLEPVLRRNVAMHAEEAPHHPAQQELLTALGLVRRARPAPRDAAPSAPWGVCPTALRRGCWRVSLLKVPSW